MANGGLDVKARQRVFDAIYNSRQKFVNLVETIKEGSTAAVTLPKDVRKLSGLMGDRLKIMLGGTYKIFQNPLGPPKIELPPELKLSKPVTVNKGEDLVLKVPYTGRPKPKVCWSNDANIRCEGFHHQLNEYRGK